MLALTAVLSALVTPAQAMDQSSGDSCESGGLSDARVRTTVTLQHDNRTYTKVSARLTVDVPGDWPLAPYLLLSEDSPRYLKAMSCLARTEHEDQQRWDEWRVSNPVVKSKSNGRIEVVDRATGTGSRWTPVSRVPSGRSRSRTRATVRRRLCGAPKP